MEPCEGSPFEKEMVNRVHFKAAVKRREQTSCTSVIGERLFNSDSTKATQLQGVMNVEVAGHCVDKNSVWPFRYCCGGELTRLSATMMGLIPLGG
jgi:hypothetical protein